MKKGVKRKTARKKIVKNKSSISLNRILELEKKQILEEKTVENLEKQELKKLDELKSLELSIRSKIGEHPLRKISYKDIGKSMIGAFIGIVGHFAILKGIQFGEEISLLRAHSFYLISFLVGLVMLYYTGFRRVNDIRIFTILPLRLILIYIVVIAVSLISIYFFSIEHLELVLIYKQVAALTLPAMIGACAADLIGGD